MVLVDDLLGSEYHLRCSNDASTGLVRERISFARASDPVRDLKAKVLQRPR